MSKQRRGARAERKNAPRKGRGSHREKARKPTEAEGPRDEEAGGPAEGPGEPAPGRPAPLVPVLVEPRPAAPLVPEVVAAGPRPELDEAARRFKEASRARNTERAYRFEVERFLEWCRLRRLEALPADPRTVSNYVAYLASFGEDPEMDRALGRRKALKAGSISRALAVVSQMHREAGLPAPTDSPEFKQVWDGTRRAIGTAQAQRTPILAADLKRMLSHVRGGLLGLRDRAMLLVCWAGAFRRSELVLIDVERVHEGEEGGLVVSLPWSKTNQEGATEEVPIIASKDPAFCPVAALKGWLAAAGISSGPAFRPFGLDGALLERRLSDDMVYDVVKRYAEAAGLDKKKYDGFGAHSLRSGFVTQARKKRKSLEEVMKVTRHKAPDMVLRYFRDADLFSEGAAGRGLLDDEPEEGRGG